MKCITYVSKVVTQQNGLNIPTGLSEIFGLARKKNAQHNITGMLSYRSGHYIQVLEGEANAVDQLYSNIKRDNRHENVTTLFEFEISKRCFGDWDMKLSKSVNKDSRFLRMMDKYPHLLETLNQQQRLLLDIFYQEKLHDSGEDNPYRGQVLELSAWPVFSTILPTPANIELCARLVHQPTSFESLVKCEEFGTEQQLAELLAKFETMGILLSKSQPNDVIDIDQIRDQSSRQAGDSFYDKMKKFLKVV